MLSETKSAVSAEASGEGGGGGKKFFYVILTTTLGFLLSFMIHAGIEIVYLNWATKNNAAIQWTTVLGEKACALPLWLIYLLPILGAIFGLWLGFYWWKKVYGGSKRV